jgi:hypothetical protein
MHEMLSLREAPLTDTQTTDDKHSRTTLILAASDQSAADRQDVDVSGNLQSEKSLIPFAEMDKGGQGGHNLNLALLCDVMWAA